MRGITLSDADEPGFWESAGYHNYGDPCENSGTGRMSWRVAAAALHDQSRTARSIVLVVPGWPGHDAGQHVDVRLTAPDGYSAVRSYSIAPAVDADRIELTVEQLPDGEVSPIWRASCSSATSWRSAARSVGGSWRPDQREPVQLIAGGSGVVPPFAMAGRMQRRVPARRSGCSTRCATPALSCTAPSWKSLRLATAG